MLDQVEGNLMFFTGKRDLQCTINMNSVHDHLDKSVSEALIWLHCFTGSDSMSALYGRGKLKAFKLMLSEVKFQNAFRELGSSFTLSNTLFSTLEQFVCRLYGQQNVEHVLKPSKI